MTDYKQTRHIAVCITTSQNQMLQDLENENKFLKDQINLIEEMGTENLNALPDCLMQLAPALVEIDELKAQIKKDALQYLSDVGQMSDAVDDLTRRHKHALLKIDILEDKIFKATKALKIVNNWLIELDIYVNPDYHLAPSLQSVRDTLKELGEHT
jgi:hypothetical protein